MTERKKILIVDDDADFVDAIRMILEDGGYEVAVAYSGQECMEQVRSDKPDLILLDMMMETWSEGTNVTDRLHRSPRLKNIPIILLSAVNFRSFLADEQAEDSLDVDAYMVKPVKAEELLGKIRTELGAA